jgi:hypothetical protein
MDGSTAPPTGRSARQRTYDVVTVALLMAGGLLVFVGWLVGAAMLWAGPRWSKRDRLLGTLVWPLGPGGLVLLFALLPSTTTACMRTGLDPVTQCTTSGWSPPSWLGGAVFATVLVTGAAVGIFLAARAARYDRKAPPAGRPADPAA